MSECLREELPYTDVKEYFWTDSKIVLGYVNNEARRFHVYVANRVQQIRDLTNPSSWQYIDTESNPADHASRGLTASQLLQGSRWLMGPAFLWKEGVFQPQKKKEIRVKDFHVGPLSSCIKLVAPSEGCCLVPAIQVKTDKQKS